MNIRKVLTFAPALVLLAVTTAFADGVVTLSPGPIGPNQQFTVAVNITGPTVKGVPSGASDVYAYEVSLSFPSSLVQAITVKDGAFLPGSGPTYFSRGVIDNGGGAILNIIGTLVASPSGASGSGTLANITFQGIAAGTPQITLTKITLLDSHLNPIVVDDTPAQVATTVTLATAEMREPGSPAAPRASLPLLADARTGEAGMQATALDETAARQDEPLGGVPDTSKSGLCDPPVGFLPVVV